MSTFDKTASKARLDEEVAQLKEREARGEKPPAITPEEMRANMLARDGVFDLASCLKPTMEILEAKSKEISAEADKYRALLNDYNITECCELCGGKRTAHWEKTFYQSYMAGQLVVVYGPCDSCDTLFKKLLVNEKWKLMGIPEKLLGCTLENFKCENDQQTKAFGKTQAQVAHGRGFLILRGMVGTGKSHLAVGVMKQVGDGIFVTEADLIAELRETYSKNSGQETMVAKYRKPKIMVLDELALEVKGVDIPQLLYRILGSRYNDNLLTVITSNETLETISSILGPRLIDRIRESLRVGTLEGESYRKRK